MTVYVDDMRAEVYVGRRRSLISHVWADSVEERDAFLTEHGIQPYGSHPCGFLVVSETYRRRCLAEGAVYVDTHPRPSGTWSS